MCEVECGQRGVLEGGCGDGVREVQMLGIALRVQLVKRIKNAIDEVAYRVLDHSVARIKVLPLRKEDCCHWYHGLLSLLRNKEKSGKENNGRCRGINQ